jgi:hypothetical protein
VAAEESLGESGAVFAEVVLSLSLDPQNSYAGDLGSADHE